MKTKLTEMFGIEYPIVQSGMQWLAVPQLAAAVCNAGGIGTINVTCWPTLDEFADALDEMNSLTNKPYIVNISLAPTQRLDNEEIRKTIRLCGEKHVAAIETSAEEFEAAVNKAYLKMRGKINVPGFRVGKAPRKIIEKMYGAEVFYEEAVNIILPDAYEAAVKEQELNVVGYPEVELESCTKDGVVFKCTVAIYPEVKLGQYKGLEAPKAEVKVAAADVNARLKEMADRNSRLVSVDRAVKKGDTADIDFEGFDNGKAFDGGKGENFDLEIGSGSFVPGFEDQLIGMKAGEEKDIDITFPENYTPELAGKPVIFHVKINEVKVKEVPAIDDEFAKDVSEFDTLKDLKADIKKKMTVERTEAAQRAFEDVLMAKVAEGVEAEDQVDFLRALDCTDIQGYFFSPPLPVEKYTEKLRQQARKRA